MRRRRSPSETGRSPSRATTTHSVDFRFRSRWRTPLSYHPTHLVAGAETIVRAGFDDHGRGRDARRGRVGAYDRKTGETLWELTLDSSANGLAVADGVYVTQRTTWRVGDDGTPMRGADAAHPTVVKLT
ncbi:hypothetical protein [Halopelagius fulvigenes]|uniref:PQQ-binding-like beta-propeller repeat protein n=1 Tax=Halopelagius fulvigenes TaxID=1198324 RepID=A0ABD5TZA2_9EURY